MNHTQPQHIDLGRSCPDYKSPKQESVEATSLHVQMGTLRPRNGRDQPKALWALPSLGQPAQSANFLRGPLQLRKSENQTWANFLGLQISCKSIPRCLTWQVKSTFGNCVPYNKSDSSSFAVVYLVWNLFSDRRGYDLDTSKASQSSGSASATTD